MPEIDQTILVVDDEASIRKLLRRYFEKESYKVLEAGNGAEMHQQLQAHKVDLITLDLSLGREDGLDLAREIRTTSSIPIIMVSGKGDLVDTVVSLELGADDYINKPFELREVIARVRAVLRRNRSNTAVSAPEPRSEKFAFDQWILDIPVRELRNTDDTVCELTTGEYDLLELFVNQSRRVLSRDQIMDGLKGNEWLPNDRTIDNQVARLRKKLVSSDAKVTLIKTIRGTGYMFTPEVRKVPNEIS